MTVHTHWHKLLSGKFTFFSEDKGRNRNGEQVVLFPAESAASQSEFVCNWEHICFVSIQAWDKLLLHVRGWGKLKYDSLKVPLALSESLGEKKDAA